MLSGLLLGLSCTAEPPTAGSGSEPPDRVLLVTIDTLRADHVGCYAPDTSEAPAPRTPQLDALAARGVRFEVALSPAPITLPAHASLMTGLDPPGHGVRHNSIYALAGDHPTLAERMRGAGYATGAVVGAAVLDGRFGLDRGFEHYDDDMRGERRSGVAGFSERTAREVVDAARGWLETAPDRFFLWVHFYDPHAVHAPPRGFLSAFASRPYAGEIAFVDAQLGRLLEAITQRWGEAGLLVALTADHGESLGEHGEITHSYTIYDATQRIPLLIAGPGLPRGAVIRTPIRLIDLAPTLLARSGAEPLVGIPGRDLSPLIAGEPEPPRISYLETVATRLDHGWSPLLGVRTERFKYIRAPRPELFDVVSDPSELHDIAAQRPDRVRELDAALTTLLAASGAAEGRLVSPSEAERERLAGLGYVIPAVDGVAGLDPASLVAVGGVDPKDQMAVLAAIASAHAAMSGGRLREALATLEGQGDESHVVGSMRAAVYLALGEPERAERDVRRVLEEQPSRPDLQAILGKAMEAQGNYAEAEVAFARAVELDPKSSSALTGLGRALERQGGVEAAIARYRLARSANPANAEPIWRLAAALIETDRSAEADGVLSDLAAPLAQHPSVALRLARAAERSGDFVGASQRVSDALFAHPSDPRLTRELDRLRALRSP